VSVGEDIRSIIQAAKAQKTIPLVATLTPTYGPHGYSNGQCIKISSVIREVVKEEKAILVDLEKEFGSDPSLIQDDGLHPSDSGTQLIALSFNDKIPK
jgi:lysophospholipase L1-like esterase